LATRSPVGKSGITPVKHDLLNAIAKRHSGALLGSTTPLQHEVWVDLTAGDGVPYEGRKWYEGCSAGIIGTNAAHSQAGRNGRITAVLNEGAATTFSELRRNIETNLTDRSRVHLINGRAEELNLAPYLPADNVTTGVFLYNDPNSAKGFALSPALIQQCPLFTTTLSTLGCNVSGMKRDPIAVREALWGERILAVLPLLARRHHDMLLFMAGDASQWAYLATTPKKWSGKLVRDWDKVCTKWEKAVALPNRRAVSLVNNGELQFRTAVYELMYTKSELNDAA
jgi:hypothetical protein